MNANQVPCPYDLTANVGPLPIGVIVEWHSEPNTQANTLVGNPSAVNGGTYYAFAKSEDGCYSQGVQVIVTCQSGQCSAPNNLGVIAATGGFLIHFQSASYPPPSNSYTVKRRLRSDPDIDASYTTIGSTGSGDIIWNTTSNRWEVLDTTAQNGVLYTYIAISNCGATQPRIDTDFSNFPTCPVVTGVIATIV
jgi:hypothetical protein